MTGYHNGRCRLDDNDNEDVVDVDGGLGFRIYF